MESLESELARARELDVAVIADAIESIGFECTRCGACCKAETCGEDTAQTDDAAGGDTEPHTATVFPDEIRRLQATDDYDFRDVARPMPYGLTDGSDGPEGETFEWALQTDDCGDCTFYDEADDGTGACTVHGDRPLICRTYPFSVALGGTSQPMGEAVDSAGPTVSGTDGTPAGESADGERLVRAHECEGLGRDISRADAEALAAALKTRAVRELEEAIAVRDNYEAVDPGPGGVVVHDSEGAKRPDGSPVE
ncbi:YkgJ family cysteine cluster protein [Halorientalis litorea]|jgi:Fe-S-cluster containining protein|uniref:YkgJ family cysteine cluster protein n=1 Tax=Halorientalis litorea TaxID=2931977 RepID=UPI001FF2AD36|nr:YkgJ family cysteine cluster protein [Halorientalis litorea]